VYFTLLDNKLERLSLLVTFLTRLIFPVKVLLVAELSLGRLYPRMQSIEYDKKFNNDKHSSLFLKSVNNLSSLSNTRVQLIYALAYFS